MDEQARQQAFVSALVTGAARPEDLVLPRPGGSNGIARGARAPSNASRDAELARLPGRPSL